MNGVGLTVKTCPDCGAPVGDDMLPTAHGCWYWGQTEEWQRRNGYSEDDIRAFQSCGGDPPCEGNAYNVHQRARDRWEIFMVFVIPLLIMSALVVIVYLSSR